MTEQERLDAIKAGVQLVIDQYEVGAGEPPAPISDGAIGSALFGLQLIANEAVEELSGVGQVAVGAASGVLNGVYPSIEAKKAAAVDVLYQGGIGAGPLPGDG